MLLPVLDARLRPNRKPRPYEGEWLAGCAVRDCPGVLAFFYTRERSQEERKNFMGELAYEAYLYIPAGFVERAPGHWVMGRHAAKSARHAPRRPRTCLWGEHDVFPGQREEYLVDDTGRVPSIGRPWYSMNGNAYITCPTCGRESVIYDHSIIEVAEDYTREQATAVK